VLVERLQLEDGTVVGYGNVLYANLDLGDRSLPVFRYKDKGGNVDYYNAKGESLRKALLRTPINGARITSGFGMRMHPLLGYSKMHRGVDFGALAGTPIYAAGDGVIDMAGANGSYGNYVRIKHDGKYSTAYAHASRIAAGIKKGVKVKQGQVIAYVGSTGRSTGAHLHYEILAGNDQINPSGVKFKTGSTLSGKDLAAFKSQVSSVQAQLKGKDGNKVAENQPAAPRKTAKN
jgi:murein DD-endopeptidase MepM/ murein hydrolase activator NlpD